jgi:hypothetical protein
MIHIKDITVYQKPKKYLAVESNEDTIYEVPISDFFKYMFGKEQTLADYYYNSETIGDTFDLYYDLISLGKDLKQDIEDYINDKEFNGKPIPSNIYPLILKYYNGKAGLSDLFILQAALGIDLGIYPDENDFKGGWDIDPPYGDDPMPF